MSFLTRICCIIMESLELLAINARNVTVGPVETMIMILNSASVVRSFGVPVVMRSIIAKDLVVRGLQGLNGNHHLARLVVLSNAGEYLRELFRINLGKSANIHRLVLCSNSENRDECDSDPYCSVCGDGEWVNCQYCDEVYCRSGEWCVYTCERDGCNRSNCRNCPSDLLVECLECVEPCTGRGGSEGCSTTYCIDCRVQECQNDWDGSCNSCVKMIAPVLAEEVYN